MKKVFVLLLIVTLFITGCTRYETLSSQENDIKNYYCSDCGVESNQKTKYCPNCGSEAIWLTERPQLLLETKSSKKDSNYTYKYEYLKKLDDLQENINKSKSLYEEESTSEMLSVESDKVEKWNDMLNDIYGLLKTQLDENEFKKLKEEETAWLVKREDKAENSAKEFEGMDYKEVQYNAYLVKLTEERCYELVNKYM